MRVSDRKGILHSRRPSLTSHKQRYADVNDDPDATVSSALVGADIFLGLSGPGSVTTEDILHMGENPIILALANPTPEVSPVGVTLV